MSIIDLNDTNGLAKLKEASQSLNVWVFKHSTQCPVSAEAHREFIRFISANPELASFQVLVIEQRELSDTIAEWTGVTHESPQALLLGQGRALWHASHGAITFESLQQTQAGLGRSKLD